jgi:hypothetical protein
MLECAAGSVLQHQPRHLTGNLERKAAMPKQSDITNKRFGHLVAIRRYGSNHNGHSLWLCMCDCGTATIVFATNLKRGLTKSCGCLQSTITHGHCRDGSNTQIYNAWRNMHRRCYTTSYPGFENYGGRGIKVIKRWHKFENFLADMKPRPEGEYSLERIDNEKGYSPKNCTWIPMADQPKNRRPRRWQKRPIC